MNHKVSPISHISRTALIAGLVIVSGMTTLAMQSPTHAVSLDLGKTVTTVTNNIPVVNQITPILTGTTSSTTPSTSAPATSTATPVATPSQVSSTTPLLPGLTATSDQAVPTSAPVATTSIQPATAQVNQVKTLQPATAASALTIPAGLSAAAKQSQIAAGIRGDTTTGVTYGSRSLDPKVAMLIFAIGIGGLLAGLAIMIAVRPRNQAQLIET